MNNEEKLRLLKEKADKKKVQIQEQNHEKMQSLCFQNGEFSIELFEEHELEIFHLMSNGLDEYHLSKEFQEYYKEKLKQELERFATFEDNNNTKNLNVSDIVKKYINEKGIFFDTKKYK
jgi:hypothetical protein